jgi:uncharacterized protein (TIGR00251 family)
MSRPWNRTPNGVVLRIRLQPRASRDRLVGLHGAALKIALTAPPVEGAANAALLAFTATFFQVPRAAVSLLSGEKSRDKHVLIQTPTPEHLIQRLEAVLARVDKKVEND